MCANASVAGATAAAAIAEGADTTSAVASTIAGSSAGAATTCFGAWPAKGSEKDETVCTAGASNFSAAPASAAPSFNACFRSEATSSQAPVADTSNSSAAAR